VQREQSHFLREEIISLLRKKAISRVPPGEVASGFYSRYFLVPKKDGNYRPILDLRVLNKTLMLLRFRMLTPRRLVQFIRPNDWFITIDRSPAGDVAHAAFPNVVPVSETQRSQKQILQNNGVLQMQESPGNLENPLVPRGVIVTRRVVVTTDASTRGWGAVCEGRGVNGLWSATEAASHINVLELRTVLLALQHFLPRLSGQHVLVRTDNTATLAYINQHDPINCALGGILEFLQQLFDEGKAASTLKVYMAAISACHAGINGSSPGSHPLASRFMAGVRRLRVPERHLIPSW